MRLPLLTLCITLVAAGTAHAGCGYAHLRPAGGRIGAAPLALGDSVMLGAAPELARRGFEVEARCARKPSEGLSLLRKRRRRGTLPEIVMFALGTNIPVTRRDIAHALRILGRRRTLMLVTPFRSGHPFQTRPMRRAARRHPGRIKLVDWSVRAQRNGYWLYGDGTHLRPPGRIAYARLLTRAAWSRIRGRFGRAPVRVRGGP